MRLTNAFLAALALQAPVRALTTPTTGGVLLRGGVGPETEVGWRQLGPTAPEDGLMAVLAPVEDRVLALVNAAAGECLRRYARPWADTSTGAAAGTAAEACWRSADNDGNGVLAADEIAAWFRQMGPDTAFLKLLSPFWQRTLPALAVQLLDCGAHCDDPTRPVVSASDFGVAVQEATGALERKIAGLRGAGQPGKRSAGAVLEIVYEILIPGGVLVYFLKWLRDKYCAKAKRRGARVVPDAGDVGSAAGTELNALLSSDDEDKSSDDESGGETSDSVSTTSSLAP